MFTAERKDGRPAEMSAKQKKQMIEYGQSGYLGFSMSLRAREAYDQGEMPWSKWTKMTLLEAIAEVFGDSVSEKAKKVPLEALKASMLEQSSWHHTGKYANKTYFYQLIDQSAEEADLLIDQLIEEKKEEKKKEEKKKEDMFSFLVVTREKNISLYRKWPKWKNFTYFCIRKNNSAKCRVIIGDDDDQTKEISGIHVISKTFFNTRKDFTKAIKKYLNLRKIGNISKKIDDFLKN